MNILIFSPTPSPPRNAGSRVRIFNLTKQLQKMGHTIHFVFYAQEAASQKDLEDMKTEWDTFTVIPKTNTWKESSSGYPLDAWYQEDISQTINKIVKRFNVDAIIVNYLMQSKLLENLPSGILKIIDAHDIFGERAQYIQKHIVNNSNNYTWYSISKEDEKRGLERADIILAIQKREAKYFASLTSKPIKVINHVEEKRFLNKSYTRLKKIGFIGTGNHPNTTSLNAFLELFLASELSKTIQIVIAGAASKAIRFEHECIVRMERVEKLETFYNTVDLIINPLTFGTGLKIKSVEALSYGVPIISTDIGFDGLQSTEPCHTLQTHQQMLQCIEKLHKAPDKLQNLANLSRDFFISYEADVNKEIKTIFENMGNRHIEKNRKTLQFIYGDLQNRIKKWIF